MTLKYFYLFSFLTACSHDKTSEKGRYYNPDQWEDDSSDNSGNLWDSKLRSNDTSSSSKLDISWTIPTEPNVAHLELTVVDQYTNTLETLILDPNQSQITLENRKADTEYSLHLEACFDENCSLRITAQNNDISATTTNEIWVLQDNGSAFIPIFKEDVGYFSLIENSENSDLTLLEYQLETNELSFSSFSAGFDTLTSSFPLCWDVSCFPNVDSLQVLNDRIFVLDSASTIDSWELNQDISCSQECPTEPFFSLPDSILLDFYINLDENTVLWSGQSHCEEQGIFIATKDVDEWHSTETIDGCPLSILTNGGSPWLHSREEKTQLYFRRNGWIGYLYQAGTSWESSQHLRWIELELENGTPISSADIRLGDFEIHTLDSETLLFRFQPATMSSEQYSFLSIASLRNP